MCNIYFLPQAIDGLQPIPRDSANKSTAAMLVKQTKDVFEKSFVYVHHHGGDDATQKPSIENSTQTEIYCWFSCKDVKSQGTSEASLQGKFMPNHCFFF